MKFQPLSPLNGSVKHSFDLTWVYVDGVYDMIHSGHYNAFWQASKFGNFLVVGVCSDSDVIKAKGPTVYTEEEWADMIRECKWVHEVIVGVPYTPTVETLDMYNC